jgi:hypothetical protein
LHNLSHGMSQVTPSLFLGGAAVVATVEDAARRAGTPLVVVSLTSAESADAATDDTVVVRHHVQIDDDPETADILSALPGCLAAIDGGLSVRFGVQASMRSPTCPLIIIIRSCSSGHVHLVMFIRSCSSGHVHHQVMFIIIIIIIIIIMTRSWSRGRSAWLPSARAL